MTITRESGTADCTVAGAVCPNCGMQGVPFSERDGYTVKLCACEYGGSLLSWQWPDESEYHAFYQDIACYHSSQQVEEGFAVSKERDSEHFTASVSRARILSAHTELGDLLDVGCGTGAFVEAAYRQGFNSFGLEPCVDLARWAMTKGRKVKPGSWHDVAGTWDVITLHDVLEHLTKPLECLVWLASHLKPYGTIVVEMPEYDSPHQRAEGVEWKHIRPRQHLWLPSKAAAEALFAKAGLEPVVWHRPLGGALGKCVWFLQER